MRVQDLLKPEAVKVVGKEISKKRALQQLAERAADVYGVDASSAFSALQDRENLGPTGVGNGVAIPHARLDGLDHVVGVFCRFEKPMDYEAVDKQPVDLIFALLAPADSGVDHLKALAAVSRLLRETTVRGKLRANADDSAIYSILTEETANQAA